MSSFALTLYLLQFRIPKNHGKSQQAHDGPPRSGSVQLCEVRQACQVVAWEISRFPVKWLPQHFRQALHLMPVFGFLGFCATRPAGIDQSFHRVARNATNHLLLRLRPWRAPISFQSRHHILVSSYPGRSVIDVIYLILAPRRLNSSELIVACKLHLDSDSAREFSISQITIPLSALMQSPSRVRRRRRAEHDGIRES